MKRFNTWQLAAGCAAGGLLMIGGLIAGKALGQPPWALIATAVGIALMGAAAGPLAAGAAATPEQKRRAEVDQRDERNAAIREKAAYCSRRFTTPTLTAATLAVALSGNLYAAGVMAAVVLIDGLSLAYYLNKFGKEM
ncbi:MAG: hypothetical protein GX558_04180 [Clostridiales bacterium]|nr:hypothetical protein [Clostridiales bacterium]